MPPIPPVPGSVTSPSIINATPIAWKSTPTCASAVVIILVSTQQLRKYCLLRLHSPHLQLAHHNQNHLPMLKTRCCFLTCGLFLHLHPLLPKAMYVNQCWPTNHCQGTEIQRFSLLLNHHQEFLCKIPQAPAIAKVFQSVNEVTCALGSYCPNNTLPDCMHSQFIVTSYCIAGTITLPLSVAGSYSSTPSSQVACAVSNYCPAGSTSPGACPVQHS